MISTMHGRRPTQDGIFKFENGIEWSVPIATQIGGNPISLSLNGISDDVVLMSYMSGQSSYFQGGWYVRAGYSAVDGHLLWGPLNHTEVENSRVLCALLLIRYLGRIRFCRACYRIQPDHRKQDPGPNQCQTLILLLHLVNNTR
jgi:hypothetical protein